MTNLRRSPWGLQTTPTQGRVGKNNPDSCEDKAVHCSRRSGSALGNSPKTATAAEALATSGNASDDNILQKIRNQAKLADMNNPAIPHPETVGPDPAAFSRAGKIAARL
jgi:hypothetical protein